MNQFREEETKNKNSIGGQFRESANHGEKICDTFLGMTVFQFKVQDNRLNFNSVPRKA